MVVRMTVTGDVTPLNELADYLDSIQETGNLIAEDVWNLIKDPLLDELRFYPPVPAGSRYKRTFRLRRGWVAVLEKVTDGYRIVISNDTTYTQWVVGSLAQNRNAASRFQRDFHAQHGWPLATDTVTFWLDAFDEQYERAFNDELEGFATAYNSRRAFTRT